MWYQTNSKSELFLMLEKKRTFRSRVKQCHIFSASNIPPDYGQPFTLVTS